jgi:hypothetical protein
VLAREHRALAHEERCDPDPRPPPRRADRVDLGGQGREAVGQHEPVTDLGLVAVVDLDDVDVEAEGVDRVQVLLDVGLGDPLEVVVPGAPRRGRGPERSDALTGGEAVRPAGEGPVEA